MSDISFLELLDRYPDEESARKFFEESRWGESGRTCPHCHGAATAVVPDEKPMPYWCRDCRQYFSVRTNTPMHRSKVPLRKWMIAMYLMSSSAKGISAEQLHKQIGVSRKTAWFMGHRIREGWATGQAVKLPGPVEVDESYVGGRKVNKHAVKKLRLGRGPVGKQAVLGMRCRTTNRVVAEPARLDETWGSGLDTMRLRGFVNKHAERGCSLYTDSNACYRGIRHYRHHAVNHSVGEYVRYAAHTNGVESFWAMFKRGFQGRLPPDELQAPAALHRGVHGSPQRPVDRAHERARPRVLGPAAHVVDAHGIAVSSQTQAHNLFDGVVCDVLGFRLYAHTRKPSGA